MVLAVLAVRQQLRSTEAHIRQAVVALAAHHGGTEVTLCAALVVLVVLAAARPVQVVSLVALAVATAGTEAEGAPMYSRQAVRVVARVLQRGPSANRRASCILTAALVVADRCRLLARWLRIPGTAARVLVVAATPASLSSVDIDKEAQPE